MRNLRPIKLMKSASKVLMLTLQCAIGIGAVVATMDMPLYGQTVPDIVPWLAANDVTWTNPGPTSSQSMPLGNGDIGLNVWAETNGAVDFYIGKSDSWGDSVQGSEGLLKLGGVASPDGGVPKSGAGACARTGVNAEAAKVTIPNAIVANMTPNRETSRFTICLLKNNWFGELPRFTR